MDILEANFPRYLLEEHDEYCNQQFATQALGASDERCPTPYSTQAVQNQALSGQEVAAPPEAPWKVTRRSAAAVILELETIRKMVKLSFDDYGTSVPPTLQRLEQQLSMLTQIFDDAEAIHNVKSRKRFFRRVIIELRLIRKYNEAWKVFENFLSTWEDEYKQQHEVKAFFGRGGRDYSAPTTWTWSAWCMNYTKQPVDYFAILKSSDRPLKNSTAILPQGGILILEHWQKEVTDVVESILEISEDDNLTVLEQLPTQANTYDGKEGNNGMLITKLKVNVGRRQYANKVSSRGQLVPLAETAAAIGGSLESKSQLRNEIVVQTRYLSLSGVLERIRKTTWNAGYL